jgi:hypothetical protein
VRQDKGIVPQPRAENNDRLLDFTFFLVLSFSPATAAVPFKPAYPTDDK